MTGAPRSFAERLPNSEGSLSPPESMYLRLDGGVTPRIAALSMRAIIVGTAGTMETDASRMADIAESVGRKF